MPGSAGMSGVKCGFPVRAVTAQSHSAEAGDLEPMPVSIPGRCQLLTCR
jgi:hypothetical protein